MEVLRSIPSKFMFTGILGNDKSRTRGFDWAVSLERIDLSLMEVSDYYQHEISADQ